MINNVVLMGRLTAAPELKTTQSGISTIRFGVAVERRYNKQGEEKQTDFIDCVAWRQTAEFISKYFNKGSMIAVVGSIQTRSYEDKNGNKRKAVEVQVENVSFCGSKSESGTGGNPNLDVLKDKVEQFNAPQNNSSYTDIPDDDLPF